MGGIITKRKLSKLRKEIDGLRAARHNIKPSDLVNLAKKLGRRPADRGKHPTYKSELLPNSNPLSIPGHPTVKVTTALSILDELQADVDRLSEALDSPKEDKHGTRDNHD